MNLDLIDRLGCESTVRQRIAERFDVPLEKRTLIVGTKANGAERLHEFDGVSVDCQFVIEVKTNKLDTSVRPRGRYDSAIKQVLITDLYFLGRITAKTKLLVLTDRPLFDLFSQDMDGLLPADIQVVYCSLTEISQ